MFSVTVHRYSYYLLIVLTLCVFDIILLLTKISILLSFKTIFIVKYLCLESFLKAICFQI